MPKKLTIQVEGTEIKLFNRRGEDYVSLTDMARKFNSRTEVVIQNWLRNRNTIEFLGLWEELHNPHFNHIEFDVIKSQTGLNSFYLSAKKWIGKTHAIGIESKAGRYGGTFAHRDIAMEFGTFLSPSFKIYLIKEFQRIQQERHQALEWDVRRILAKVNYHIHTDSVRENRVPLIDWNTKREGIFQASEADLLNIVVFGQTAKQWQQANPKKKGNQRDHASPEQLVVLANMEAINSELMREGVEKRDRFQRLAAAAQYQLSVLNNLRLANPGEEQKKLDE